MLRYFSLACGLVAATAGSAGAQTVLVATTAPEASGGSGVAPTVYFTADKMPTYPGGDVAMLKFLSSRLNYPAPALDRNLSGKVFITFTVDPEGRLHNPHVVRGLGFGLDDEALRLVRLMPWWNPGQINGQPVWVTLTMPVVFRAL